MRVFSRRRALVLVLLVAVLSVAASVAARSPGKKRSKKKPPPPAPATAPAIDYASEVRPILETHCYRCHGPTKQKGGLRLDTSAGIRKGGESGGLIVPGDGTNSPLVAVLTGTDDTPRMPPAGEPLSAEQIGHIKRWIDAGAHLPPESAPEPAPETARHWAFVPPVAPTVPRDGHPIDALLSVGREARGLVPSPSAPPAVLLRRVYIDLIGLPPTRAELAAFLANPSAEAYEKVVDELLADPRYGERWARHWMDVWRYSEADGRKSKADVWWSSPHLWRWRDWIVESLNADKGYDRMLAEMLAGDELTAPAEPAETDAPAPVRPDDLPALAATGFLVRNHFKLDRNVWLSNTVEHTGKAFLGLSIGCARCHDHKFDPVLQKEYYRFRALFEPHDVRADPVAGETGPTAHVARAFDRNPDAPTWLLVRGDPNSPDKSAPMSPAVPPVLGTIGTISPPHSSSSGRRLALARWLGSRTNPLTARVAVNHVWMRHFGKPLVENVADFGTRTAPPVQQPLLDWLAVELVDHGWSFKHLHRLIVTSAAYKMRSATRSAPARALEIDPDNTFYWRANSQRMEAEVLRDSLLYLAGALEPTAGGPPVDPARGTETGRRSLYYRYSRDDKMEFLTAFDAPGVEECYRREKSIVPQQALALENSAFSWDQARRIARRLEAELPADFVIAAFEHVLGRPPEPAEAEACASFLVRQEELLSDPDRLTPLPPSAPEAKRESGLPLVFGEAKPLPPVEPAAEPARRAREYLIHALLNHNDFITVR